MSRRFALPLLAIAIASVFWWLDRAKEQQRVQRAALAEPAAKPQHPITADEFIGPAAVARWEPVEDFEKDIALFESVFWEPADTTSLRKLIRDTQTAKDRSVLEIGTGSGLVSLVCLQAGASRVVATDINPAAVRNAVYNARQLGLLDRFEVRLVPRRNPSAWSVLRDGERFDLIISNPPWEDDRPDQVSDFALYDPQFGLLKSILAGTKDRLNPGGRLLLAYGCVTAIRTIEDLAPQHGLRVTRHDERVLDDLPEVFLPGMLLEIVPDDSPRE